MTQSRPPSPSVLILGARGRFGSAAVRAFAQAGWQVHAQLRPGAVGPSLTGVQWVHAEPQDTATLARAARGATVVVQALSPVYTHRAWRTDVPRLTSAAIAVTRELGATLMLPASVYNFGSSMPPRLLEDTPQRPSTLKGRLRLASEEQILQATHDGRMKAVVIRGGDFFGSGQGSWLDQAMVKDLPRGKLTYPGPLDVPTTWAYLPDMARSFVQVAGRCDVLPAFETFHFGGYQLTGQDWALALTDVAREQGWLAPQDRLQVSSVSWPLFRALGLFMPMLAALSEMRYLWTTPYQLVNTRMAALVGPEPHTPFPQALRAALADLGLLQRGAAPGAPALRLDGVAS
ncbi:MAG: sugar nucleotide-binding protein [Ramlibacter sp.]|nr:sugar nucleotide-binding protein [Ramlibacter sp.]